MKFTKYTKYTEYKNLRGCLWGLELEPENVMQNSQIIKQIVGLFSFQLRATHLTENKNIFSKSENDMVYGGIIVKLCKIGEFRQVFGVMPLCFCVNARQIDRTARCLDYCRAF